MSVSLTPEIKERYGPWDSPRHRADSPPTCQESRARTEARYSFLRHWQGVSPELMWVARFHPDAELRIWLNALISSEEARSEAVRRHEAGLGPRPAESEPHADDDVRGDVPSPGWADAYN